MDVRNDPYVEGAIINSGQTLQTEEIVHEDEGDAVSSVGETEFIPYTITNDHTYVLLEPETGNVNVPSPRTGLCGGHGEAVDIKLRVEEHSDCAYSPHNGLLHVKSQGKLAITTVLKGLYMFK